MGQVLLGLVQVDFLWRLLVLLLLLLVVVVVVVVLLLRLILLPVLLPRGGQHGRHRCRGLGEGWHRVCGRRSGRWGGRFVVGNALGGGAEVRVGELLLSSC